ncbi:MAG: c-type cytochrome [Balneola sp.]
MNRLIIIICLIGFIACKGDNQPKTSEKTQPAQTAKISENGVGPVSELTLPDGIDQEMVSRGKEIFDAKCSACHKTNKRYIGPDPTGILERRTPAWVMNMILNPDGMVKEDPVAKQLLMEYNGTPMANQNLTEDEARAILEYFRTLKPEQNEN